MRSIRLGSFTIAFCLAASAFCFDFRGAIRSATSQNANSSTVTAENTNTEQTDLSGTYTGTFDCPDAGLSGETTLTITGNQYTLSDGKTGRIVAVTTRGYTGATMQFGEFTVPAPGQAAGPAPVIISMRARKSGDRLTLTPVSGEKHVCSFTPAGGTRMRRRARAVNTNINSNTNMNDNTGTPEATPTPTPSIRR
jgi:hypothetical protein